MFDPRDYNGDNGTARCPSCDGVHPANYQFSRCSHPACDARGCHLCIDSCGMSAQCGEFCAEHLVPVPISARKSLMACLRCEAESMAVAA